MTAKEIIASGKLKLYVLGSLSAEEISEVEAAIATYPEVRKEITSIKSSPPTLTKAGSSEVAAMTRPNDSSNHQDRRITNSATRTKWTVIIGWAAAILCLGGIFLILKKNNVLQEKIQFSAIENTQLKDKLTTTQRELADANNLLAIVRSKEYKAITLPGNQAVAPKAFAKVYYNQKDKTAYIDLSGLPKAPSGKIYQLWSLTMNPFTPTSIGLLNSTTEVGKRVFRIDNVSPAEAMGITLEAKGGSEFPTLSQLYTLGNMSR